MPPHDILLNVLALPRKKPLHAFPKLYYQPPKYSLPAFPLQEMGTIRYALRSKNEQPWFLKIRNIGLIFFLRLTVRFCNSQWQI